MPTNLALQQVETTLNLTRDYRNIHVIAVTRYIDSLGFGVVVKMDHSEVYAITNNLKIVVLQLIIGLIFIVIVVSILLSNMLTKPVINITEAAIMISEGNYEKRIMSFTKDELGKLANALNEMAERLIHANQFLEEKIKERTKELHETNLQLEVLSQTDALTGIANRGKFDSHLENSLRKSRRYNKTISVILLDIDHFKAVNDNYGHQTGD